MTSLASDAAVNTASSSFRIDLRRHPTRVGAQPVRRRRAPASPAHSERRSSSRSDSARSTLNAVTSSTSSSKRQRAVADRALVVERPRRKIGRQHQAADASARMRIQVPTSGASQASSSGVAPMRSAKATTRDGVHTAGRRRRVAPRDLRRTSSSVPGRSADADSGAPDEKPVPPQPILVIHRRLVHDVHQPAGILAGRGCGRR